MIASIGIFVAFVTVLAGIPVLAPASFAANRDAIRNNWIKSAKPPATSQPPRERVTSVIQFKKRGGNS